MESSFHKSPNTIHCPCHWVPFTRLTLQTFCECTVLHFVSTLTRWHVSLSAEKPCYSFYISRKTELILDRLRYITKYRRTLSVSARERYDFLVSICPVSLVSCRWLNSRGLSGGCSVGFQKVFRPLGIHLMRQSHDLRYVSRVRASFGDVISGKCRYQSRDFRSCAMVRSQVNSGVQEITSL